MILGFTGTQIGCTKSQLITLGKLFVSISPSGFHHGDCIGADTEAHMLIRELVPNCKITLHPPEIKTKRSFCQADWELNPKPYLERNRVIVNSSEMLIATPKENEEVLRSGTWSTVRYAKKLKHEIIIIKPDGSFVHIDKKGTVKHD